VATTSRNSTRSGRGAAGGRSSKSKPKRPSKKRRAQDRREIRALVLIALGLILGLGNYTEATGIIVRLLASAIGALVGRARYAVPPALVAAGWYLLRNRGRRRRRPRRSINEYLAWGCGVVAAFSLLDLIGGTPHWGSSVEDLSRAGGWVGVNLGGTLERYFGHWGQIIVTITLVVAAAVLLTSMSVASVVRMSINY
jgi:hypothetical protein